MCTIANIHFNNCSNEKRKRKKSVMSSYKCRYEKKSYLTIKYFSTLFFMYTMVPCEKMIISSFFLLLFLLHSLYDDSIYFCLTFYVFFFSLSLCPSFFFLFPLFFNFLLYTCIRFST